MSYDHDIEKAALLGPDSGPTTYGVIQPVESEIETYPFVYHGPDASTAEIPRAVKNTHAAIRVESMTRYLDDADHAPFAASRSKVLLALNCTDKVRRGRSLTINHGDSGLSYREPGEERVGPLLSWGASLFDNVKSAELRKREAEIGTKMRAMYKSTLGERINDMIELEGLATAPAKQGRGYATALVKVLNDIADAQGRAVYLLTDDAKWFYEELGYVLVAEDWAGVGNPTWNGDPVPIRVMVREPKSAGGYVDEKKGLTKATRGAVL